MMSNHRLPLVVVRAVLTTLMLAMGLRTFVVMGLIAPVFVAGNSMAPALRGPHCAAPCPICNQTIRVAAEYVPAGGVVPCPHCAAGEVDFSGSVIQRGDSLVIDRTVFYWREPRRWEPVVFYCPQDGGGLCVKRVVGLPGETIELRGGEVLVDGEVAVKSLALQRTLRQPIHCEGEGALRWRADAGWGWKEGAWHFDPQSPGARTPGLARRLRYHPPDNQPITDNMPYNASLSRRLNPMVDLMLSAQVENLGSGALIVEVGGQGAPLSVRLDWEQQIAEIRSGTRKIKSVRWSSQLRKSILLEISTFDAQLLLAIDGEVLLCHPLADNFPPEPTTHPFAITAENTAVALRELSIWRDVYFTESPVGIAPSGLPLRQKLASAEYFVLGENSPISLDGRVWGPLPARRLVGRPLGVR